MPNEKNKFTARMLPRPSRKCFIPDFWPEVQLDSWQESEMLKVKLTSRGKGKKKKGMLKPRPAGQQRSIKLRLLRKRKTTNKKVFPLRRGLGGSTGSRSSSTNAMLHHHISPRSDKQSTDSRGAFCTFHVIIGQRRAKDETRVVSVCSSCCKSTSLV